MASYSLAGTNDRPLSGGWLAEVKSRFARHRLYRKTLKELSELDPCQLADLGLTPTMLPRVAYQAAYDIC
ncbi:DUF1127 domain-containing protein [Sedimentitalea sp. JM2-8]|uniref:DUF1127 domain-containing protein n=1 Tax=Sedimentitalea xiamensis TaxID=3050037 RepID=A0ABT7FER1_9RHOB|nr:DUF1127 domain-containing protein [Sedimentitalea xiamensis]MDK3073572.1 DUF1127 domain-containing protein [Sedimentitalea xiamensis]